MSIPTGQAINLVYTANQQLLTAPSYVGGAYVIEPGSGSSPNQQFVYGTDKTLTDNRGNLITVALQSDPPMWPNGVVAAPRVPANLSNQQWTLTSEGYLSNSGQNCVLAMYDGGNGLLSVAWQAGSPEAQGQTWGVGEDK